MNKNNRALKIRLAETDSTNSEIRRRLPEVANGTAFCTDTQTAGRGQRGNTWESAPYKNVTMSILIRPKELEAVNQFRLSMAVSLGAIEALKRLLPAQLHDAIKIKWPNDIYVHDSKIAGILIESSLQGKFLDWSIIGIGLNVNQDVFLSDAPNPISIKNLTGNDIAVEDVEDNLQNSILDWIDKLDNKEYTLLQSEYMSHLWRRTGLHPFVDAATKELFMASIKDVSPTGVITLEDTNSLSREYLFKEVTFVLDE